MDKFLAFKKTSQCSYMYWDRENFWLEIIEKSKRQEGLISDNELILQIIEANLTAI